MYKNSLVLGKFYCVHLGHLFLIDTAISESEQVNVIITHNKSQFIPGEFRYNVLNYIYKDNPKVTIHLVSDDGLPQHDNECSTLDEFYSYWVPLVYNTVSNIDAVFTSEDYGDDFAKYLGVEHRLVDKERKKYPISGTKARTNPIEYWNFMPNEMKKFFVKRVALMGPESVGKSTLTQKLSEYYQTNYVEEYGRTVFENNGNKISIDDFIPISIGRQLIEDELIVDSNKIIFCDTEDITTYLFSKMFFPNDYNKVENFFTTSFNSKPKYDLYILLKPDCDGVQDGTRQFLDERWDHYISIKNELISQNCRFIEIEGDWEFRFKKSIEVIDNNILNELIYTKKLINQ